MLRIFQLLRARCLHAYHRFQNSKACILPTPRTNIYVFRQNNVSFGLSSKKRNLHDVRYDLDFHM